MSQGRADAVDYRIIGDSMQAVIVALDQDESVRAEAGAMMFMTGGVEMEASTGGGILSGLKRMLAGESFFITSFRCAGRRGEVAFAAPYPGKIIPLDLDALGGAMLCQRDAYLCSARGVEVSVAFTKRFGAGLFGGEGFVLQKLEGKGLAFVHAGGAVHKVSLAEGEAIKADTGCLVALQPSVDYDIGLAGGIKTALFGGEGLFLATLTGPGDVYLQTLPFSRLADRIAAAGKSGREEVERAPGALGEAIGGE
ncbi:MAG: TIGR00266 family protein [Elusimicrobia bacterium]|nr:TIGR00266 family protein [Elusimicrobiota bacterium]